MAKYYEVGRDGSSLEAEADRWLRKAGAFSRSSGIHKEENMLRARKRGKEVSIDGLKIEMSSDAEVTALLDCLWEEIIAGAHKTNCSLRQIEYLELRRLGNTCDDIAEQTQDTWGKNGETVRTDLKKAADKIQTIEAFGLWSVLAEVFKCSVKRIKTILLYN